MRLGRRELILAGVGVGASLAAGTRGTEARAAKAPEAFSTYGLTASGADQTASLQDAADRAAQSGTPFFLPAGTYSLSGLSLKSGTVIAGVPGRSILASNGGSTLLSIENGSDVSLSGITLSAEGQTLGDGNSLLAATGVKNLDLTRCRFLASSEDGVVLRKVSGSVRDCECGNIRKGALFSEDATGLEIAHNHIHDCGDNGILVWRSDPGEDGTLVIANRVERIAAKSGGSGQNGNGINIFRANSVLISANWIADCAYSAIRSNAGGNCQILGNHCARLGEVALYAEFAFEGVIIANNIVDHAAMGISVTNFKQGGRLAVVQGNLIRNIAFRDDPDPRGAGIGVEADSIVSGNLIENASAFGITIGSGVYLRDVSVTDNLLRDCQVGIGVSGESGAGQALITDNLISGSKQGAIRVVIGSNLIGPDLARESAEAYRNLAVYANVAR